MDLAKCWTKDKPDYACVFVTRQKDKHNIYSYEVWEFRWEIGEPPEDAETETTYYYLAWTDENGEEWDDIKDCNFNEYLVLEILHDMNGG